MPHLARRTVSRKKAPAHRKVGRLLIEASEAVANEMMERNPVMKERWLDHHRMSTTSDREGLILLTGSHDWSVAFWLWYVGKGKNIPREPE